MKKMLFLASLAFATTFYAAAQDKEIKQRTISVSGTAEMEVTPDEIYVQVDLKEYDKKGVGKIDIETIKRNFLAACKSIGIAETDITVHSYGGDGNTYWQLKKSKKKNPDLKASISYWIKLSSTAKMDELVDKLDDEATENFFIAKTEYSKRDELKKQLKILAIKAAKAKATYLTEAIDEHVGEALTINDVDYTNFDNNIVVSQYRANTSNTIGNDDNATEVGFNKMKFQFQVSVVFAIK